MDKLKMDVDTPEETGQEQGGGDKTEKQGKMSQEQGGDDKTEKQGGTSQEQGGAIQEGASGVKRQLQTPVSQPQLSTSGATSRAQQSAVTFTSVLQQSISMAQAIQEGTSGLQLMSKYLMSASENKVTFP